MDLILFVLVGYIIYHLWNLLGTRTGFEKDLHSVHSDHQDTQKADITLEPGQFRSLDGLASTQGLSEKVALLEEKQPGFTVKDFLESAKKAFSIIVEAYYKSDLETLSHLLSDQVLKSFETHPAKEIKTIVSVEAEVHNIDLDDEKANVTVLFRSNQNNVWIVDYWIFSKNHLDTKWILTGTLKKVQ